MNNNNKEIFLNLLDILNNTDKSLFNEDTLNFYTSFIGLPLDEQGKIFDSMLNNINYYKKIQQENINKQICEKNGHDYSNWYESYSFRNYRGSTFKNKIWCKKCLRCGDIYFTFSKPNELIDDINKDNIKLKKLNKIKNN